MSTKWGVRALKTVLWLGALAPAAWLVAGLIQGRLGPNPIETLTLVTGTTALVLLLVTLAVTPLRRLTGWNPLIRLRRPLGLFAFFYVVCHFSVWFVFDMVFNPRWMIEDIIQRPYITVGFAAFLLLIPLAVTSTKGWIRRLGKRWTKLHRLAYLATALAVVHYFWVVKADTRLPFIFAVILVILIATRIPLARSWARRTTPERAARKSSERSATS
ncbi:MAG: protein-methionine-sulfoxide reductase heme-binding subunit MsrQ [Gemmatimonadota bacterium]